MTSPGPVRGDRPASRGRHASPVPPGAGPGEVDPSGRRRRTVEGLGTPALALGVIAAGVGWLGWPGVAVGLVAIVLGGIGARRAFHDPRRTGGAALGGLALGLVGLVVGAVIVAPDLLGVGEFGTGLTLDECMDAAQGQQEQRICASQHLEEYKARYPAAENI